jgi:hypothetical protein
VRCFYTLTILLVCDCLSSLGAAPLTALAEEEAVLDRILYKTNIEPSCRYQKVSYKSDPTWAKFPSPRHPSVSFLTHCSSATVPVSGGGTSSGHGRRGSCFWTEYCPTLLSYLSIPEGSVQVGSSHSDYLCRYQKVSYKSDA